MAMPMSADALIGALKDDAIKVDEIMMKTNKFNIRLWQLTAADQNFMITTDAEKCGGYNDLSLEKPFINFGLSKSLETALNGIQNLPDYLQIQKETGALSSDIVKKDQWFDGPYSKGHYDANDVPLTEEDGSPLQWQTLGKGDLVQFVISPRIWQKDAQCGIKLWIKRAQLIKRCDYEGPGMFAPVTVWDPSLRLDKMERMSLPEAKRPKIARTDTTAPNLTMAQMIRNTQLNDTSTADMDAKNGEEDGDAPLRRAMSVA
jgi:hypothetical protein